LTNPQQHHRSTQQGSHHFRTKNNSMHNLATSSTACNQTRRQVCQHRMQELAARVGNKFQPGVADEQRLLTLSPASHTFITRSASVSTTSK
jgi:hypothetical protein